METLKVGDRIELISMPNDPNPIPFGTKGTVKGVTPLSFFGSDETQIVVNWDNGRRLNLICPPDQFKIINE